MEQVKATKKKSSAKVLVLRKKLSSRLGKFANEESPKAETFWNNDENGPIHEDDELNQRTRTDMHDMSDFDEEDTMLHGIKELDEDES